MRLRGFGLVAIAGVVTVLSGLGGAAGPPVAVAAAPGYTITELLPIDAFDCWDPKRDPRPSITSANAINDSGAVTGYAVYGACDSSTETILWQNGHPSAFGFFWQGFSNAGTAINADGTIAAWTALQGGPGGSCGDVCRPIVIENGVMADLGFPGAPAEALRDGRGGQAFGINDGGDIVGSVFFQTAQPPFGQHAFLWSALTHTALDLGTLGGVDSYAWGINNSGVVVGKSGTQTTESRFGRGWSGDQTEGYRAFRWSVDTGMVDLGPGSANAINRHGWIVGSSDGQGFLLRPGGKMQFLGDLTVSANAINDHGVIVGTPAFRYQGSSVIDLNSLVAGSGWTLLTATGINNSGQIVGQGIVNGTRRGYLLTPS